MNPAKLIPQEVWIFLIALNLFMFFLNMAMEMPSYMMFNLVSGGACYMAYYLNKPDDEVNDE